jgi:hypothetical protein
MQVILYVIMEKQVGTVMKNIMRQKTDIYKKKIILSVVYFTMISATENIALNGRTANCKGFEGGKMVVVLPMVSMNLQGLNKTTYSVKITDEPE